MGLDRRHHFHTKPDLEMTNLQKEAYTLQMLTFWWFWFSLVSHLLKLQSINAETSQTTLPTVLLVSKNIKQTKTRAIYQIIKILKFLLRKYLPLGMFNKLVALLYLFWYYIVRFYLTILGISYTVYTRFYCFHYKCRLILWWRYTCTFHQMNIFHGIKSKDENFRTIE